MIQGEPNTTAKVQFITAGPVSIEKHIGITLLSCPPGFISSNKNSSSVCICDSNYGGVVHCDPKNFNSSIVRHAWLGFAPESNVLVYGFSPYIKKMSRNTMIALPSDENDLDAFFCNTTHSTGILCGRCLDDYGVAINGLTARPCVSCSDDDKYYNWMYYILLNFLPVTLFFAIVFIFSMTVTLGPLNSFIFFAQMMTTMMTPEGNGLISYRDATHGWYSTLKNIYFVPYDIWNLNFFHFLTDFFCLSPKLNYLDVMCLKYVEAVYPLLLLIVFVCIMTLYNRGVAFVVCLCRPFHQCLARFRQLTNMRQSLTGGMAVFIVISYTNFTLVSLNILAPQGLYTSNETLVKLVFYFEGDLPVDWNNPQSIKYILTAVAMLCVFGIVPPFLLVYPSLLKLIEWLSCHRLSLSRLYPPTKLQAFLDEFHGCYRNGTDGGIDCRWFAGLYFLLRLSLFIIYAETSSDHVQFTAQLLLFLFCSFLFLVFRPYRESWINQVDATIFLIMAGISATSMHNLLMSWIDEPINITVFIIQYILILLPLIYCIGYCFVLMYSKCKDNCKDIYKLRKMRQSQVSEPTTDEDSDRESLVDSTHIPNFLDYVHDTDRMRSNVKLSHSHKWRSVPSTASDDETRPLLSTPSSNTSGSTATISTGATCSTNSTRSSMLALGNKKAATNQVTHTVISINSCD